MNLEIPHTADAALCIGGENSGAAVINMQIAVTRSKNCKSLSTRGILNSSLRVQCYTLSLYGKSCGIHIVKSKAVYR